MAGGINLERMTEKRRDVKILVGGERESTFGEKRLSRKESDVTARRPRKDISDVSIPIKVNNTGIDECDKPEVLPSFGGRSFDTDARRNMKKATKKIIRP